MKHSEPVCALRVQGAMPSFPTDLYCTNTVLAPMKRTNSVALASFFKGIKVLWKIKTVYVLVPMINFKVMFKFV